jgi:hypothetical protein
VTGSLPVPGDLAGYELKPDPLAVTSAADLIRALREYKTWAGDLSLRNIARSCDHQVSPAAICLALGDAALERNELPRLPIVVAVVSACSSNDEGELATWATAWRMLRMNKRPADGRPALRAVASG